MLKEGNSLQAVKHNVDNKNVIWVASRLILNNSF